MNRFGCRRSSSDVFRFIQTRRTKRTSILAHGSVVSVILRKKKGIVADRSACGSVLCACIESSALMSILLNALRRTCNPAPRNVENVLARSASVIKNSVPPKRCFIPRSVDCVVSAVEPARPSLSDFCTACVVMRNLFSPVLAQPVLCQSSKGSRMFG